MEYDFSRIERKWQDFWESNGTFKTQADSSKPKYYILDMFPYPSGAGIHMGHPAGYTATDTLARYKRMRGFNVLHPMGWDSFGLPAENYALKTGIHPKETSAKNIANFRRQLKMLGFSYDWDREVTTSDPNYYRWTQWIFLKLYRKGLAFEKEVAVNWCPALGTVLANEEVVDGRSEVGGHPVERKPMKQWVLKITDYAERLLADLEGLDWPENIKELQRNWIGRSEGAEIFFRIEGRDEKIAVFSSRPDTLFGATYLVLAPEHPLVPTVTTGQCRQNVQRYLEEARKKSDIERTGLAKEKTGVFSGSYATNPASGARIPIWVADYVLASYATGAIMAVAAHDDRDFEFARSFRLPIIEVVRGGDTSREAYTGDGRLVNSGFLDGLDTKEAARIMCEWLEEKGFGKKKVSYKLHDWLFSRQRYWGEPFPLLKDPRTDQVVRLLKAEELPLELPTVDNYKPSATGASPLARIDGWMEFDDPVTGRRLKRESHTMPQWAGSCWYYLRFIDPHNDQEPWSAPLERHWMPVDLYVGGVEHAVLHLLYARFWHKVLYDLGLVSTSEPFKKLVNQGLILGEDGEKMSKSRGNGVSPDEVVAGYGADSLRLYQMFMGPLEKPKPWQTKGIRGVHGFLHRSFKFFSDPSHIADEDEPALLKALHKCIRKVTEDTEALRFNTAISAMMVFANQASKCGRVSKQTAESFCLLLAPFAPHAAEELWECLGHGESLAHRPWPSYDASLAQDETITMAVQVDGKTRTTLTVHADISREDFLKLAKEDAKIQRHIGAKTIVREIFVPGKIANIIVS